MTSHKTKAKLDWRAVTSDTPDVDDIWGEDMLKLLAEHLPTDDNGDPPARAIIRLADAARPYRALKASTLPKQGQTRAYLEKCSKAAVTLNNFLNRMDQESRRMLAEEAETADPTPFDPENDEFGVGNSRIFQSTHAVRRIAGWLKNASQKSPRKVRPSDPARYIVSEAIALWEKYNKRKFRRGGKTQRDYLVPVCKKIDWRLTDAAIDNAAKNYKRAGK